MAYLNANPGAAQQRALALLLLRLVVAGIFLWHGLPKALDASMAQQKFIGFGLPGLLGPITGWVEVVASVLLLTGYGHRWAALILAAVIAGALVTVQIPGGLTPSLERDALILAAALVLAASGPGRYVLARRPPAEPRRTSAPA